MPSKNRDAAIAILRQVEKELEDKVRQHRRKFRTTQEREHNADANEADNLAREIHRAVQLLMTSDRD